MQIDKEFAELIPPLTAEEYKGLEANIVAEGCRDALVLWNDILVDGHNRYKVCREHGIAFQTVQKEFVDRNAVKLWMLSNQLGRRNLNDFQRIEMVRKCEDAVKARAKERQESTQFCGVGNISHTVEKQSINQGSTEGKMQQMEYHEGQYESGLRENLPKAQNIREKSSAQESSTSELKSNVTSSAPLKQQSSRATEELGAMAGVSHKTYEHATTVLDKAPEELVQAVRNGDVSINKAYQQVKRAEKEAKREEVRQQNAEKVQTLSSPLDAQGLFQTIVIDPAWDWDDEGDVNQFGRAKPDYHTMPFEEILSLPISKIADKNSHLYIWVTNRSLPKAFKLMDAWGFRYITCLTWVKPSIGMGNYFRGSTEQILFGVRGSQPLKRHDVGTWFEAQRGSRHSEKPDEFYRLAESCSHAPRIDIFGRKRRDGWTVWGENT